jgi:hypothetical protein
MFHVWSLLAIVALYILTIDKQNLRPKIPMLIIQALIVLALMGVLPSFLFSFYNMNAVFFISVQMFLAGGILVAIIPNVEAFYLNRKIRFARIALYSSYVVIAMFVLLKVRGNLKFTLKENYNACLAIHDPAQPPIERFSFSRHLTQMNAAFPHIEAKLRSYGLYKLVQDLINLDRPSDKRHDTLISADLNKSPYVQHLTCAERAHLVSALSGYSMINGAPADCNFLNYGGIYYVNNGQDKRINEPLGKEFKHILYYDIASN